MTGFMTADGAQLAGGKLPGGVGEALNLDAQGNLLVATGAGGSNQNVNLAQINGAALPMSQEDGASLNALLELALMGYNSGGPVLANGVPTQLAWDRLRTWLGKGNQSNAITATNVGDTSLTFSVAPKTLMPGQAIKLSGGAIPEYVYVADSFTPSATATSIPLKSPVVNAGQTTAQWSVFNTAGPGNNAVPPEGLLPIVPLTYDPNTGNLYAAASASLDAQNGRVIPEHVAGIFNSATIDRWQGKQGVGDVSVGGRSSAAIAAGVAANTVVKASAGRLARILVTATGTAELDVFDNASTNSGTKIGIVPANAAVGTLIDCQAPATNGITVGGNASNPGVTIFYY